jgi:hypothetical protein
MLYGPVQFAGLTVEPDDLLRPRLNRGVVPCDWSLRYVAVPVLDSYGIEMWRVNEWLGEHFDGEWAVISHQTIQGLQLIIAFARQQDAALFVLMDGANAMIETIQPG